MQEVDIKTKLHNLPDEPGVYEMFDADGNILYVGKAKVLKNRVRQYFFATEKPEKVMAMLSHVADFRYIITASESDALSLENTLIKKYTPPYNILLKDDKQYPYVKVDLRAEYPKFVATRRLQHDGCRYFGPITVGGVKNLIDILGKVFPTITCNYNFDKLPKNFRPCLNYDIARCCAPCIGNVSKDEYRQIVNSAVSFLEGDDQKVREVLQQKMMQASDQMLYEQALEIRRYLQLLDKMHEKRLVVLTQNVNYDIFAITSNGRNSVVNHTTLRGGKVVNSENFAVSDGGIDEGQTLSSFLVNYVENVDIAGEVFVNVELEDQDTVAELMSEICHRKITLTRPQKQVKKQLVDMAERNAVEYLTKSQTDIDKRFNSTVGAVTQLKQVLELTVMPKRIECYDISNVSGVDKVASMVVFTNGEKDAKAYRSFRIKTVEGANDFACMKEVITRRLVRAKEGDASFLPLPDLIVIDGGLGQLGYAKQAMDEVGLSCQMISLAEKEELVFTLKNNLPIRLPRNSFALNLLVNVRDEAHRFAITYFRKLHGKNALKSVLADIDGVGEKRVIALQRKFKSLEALSNASVDEIADTPTMTVATAQKVYDFLHGKDE